MASIFLDRAAGELRIVPDYRLVVSYCNRSSQVKSQHLSPCSIIYDLFLISVAARTGRTARRSQSSWHKPRHNQCGKFFLTALRTS